VSNQTLKADEAAYRSAVEVIGVDRGTLFPSVSVNAGVTRSGSANGVNQAITTSSGTTVTTGVGGNGHRTTYSAGAQASWSLDVWGRIRRLVESDVAKAQASAADVAAARCRRRSRWRRIIFSCAPPTSRRGSTRPISKISRTR
jgi:outer membrane protein TolC